MTPKKELESAIQHAVCEYLEWKRYFFSRTNNTPIFDPRSKTFRKMPKYALKGFPDIVVMHKGKVIFLEIKKKGGYQSKEQKEFEQNCINNNIEYHVIRDVSQLGDVGL